MIHSFRIRNISKYIDRYIKISVGGPLAFVPAGNQFRNQMLVAPKLF